MRQRKILNNDLPSVGVSSDESDPENSIQAVYPSVEEEEDILGLTSKTAHQHSSENDIENEIDIVDSSKHSFCFRFMKVFVAGKAWWVQCLTITIAALLTYSYNNINASVIDESNGGNTTTNVQVAIMTVIILVGASPFRNTHLTTAAIGTFVGGQNIIGSTDDGEFEMYKSKFYFINYLWLLILSMIVGLIWCFIITNSRLKILDGYAGRLGSTTFIGMNVTMLVVFGPLRVVDWNRYYYGFLHVVHVGEEDSSPTPSLASAWTWTEEIELAIGYALAVIWLGVTAGTTRIFHLRYVQQWNRINKDSSSLSPKTLSISIPTTIIAPAPAPAPSEPEPLNNILIPVLYTLLSILVVNATQYLHSPGLYNGFAVGAYVAMASLQKIPTITKFTTVSIIAAGFGLALTPFCVGFAGKSGFTAMCGHVTHIAVETIIEYIRASVTIKRRQQQQQQEDEQSETLAQQIELIESNLPQAQEQEEEETHHHHQQQQQQKEQQSFHLYHSHKPSKKKEYVTKQQRRQQQRLQHHNQQQHNYIHQQQQRQQQHESVVQLHHRAWDATIKKNTGDDGVWEHPKLSHKTEAEHHIISHETKVIKIDVI
mmetsp:Transcript_23724/g.23997  ORF Transcript_23724/g.23997 Transcript_23724/m.23997 type:complete len:598 (+) Transcript_23724:37-1830(+)